MGLTDIAIYTMGLAGIIGILAIVSSRMSRRTYLHTDPNGCRVHQWQVVEDTDIHRYYQCRKCSSRCIRQVITGVGQPIDRVWLETGRWQQLVSPPGPSNTIVRTPYPFSPPKNVKDQ